MDYSEVGGSTEEKARSDSSRVDYRELLQPEGFTQYVRLRELRKRIAEEEGIPHYAVFTNEQLAEIARLENPSKDKMSQISGIGKASLTKYGDRFLVSLATEEPECSGDEANR